jgi:uncharacterized protein
MPVNLLYSSPMQIRRYPIHELISGDFLHVSAFEFAGTLANAPSVYLQAALHGAEIQGNLVIEILLKYFQKNPPLGRVTLVPFCNPMGANLKEGDFTQGRYEPVSGNNWNRCFIDQSQIARDFLQKNPISNVLPETILNLRAALIQDLNTRQASLKSAAHRLAWRLQRMAVEHDHVLDLHCDMDSVTYLYAPEYALDDTAYLGIDFAFAVPHSFMGAMEDGFFAPWAVLADSFLDKPLQLQNLPRSFTLELGNQEIICRKRAQTQAEGILNYLRHRNVISHDQAVTRACYYYSKLADVLDLPAPTAGLSELMAPLGTVCEQGSPLIRITNLMALREDADWSKVTTLVLAPASGIPITTLSSASVLPGADVVKFMTCVNRVN